MISSFVRALISAFKARRKLALENIALRQQLAVLVGSRYSCDFPMVETEQPAKPFTVLNGAL